MFIYLLFLFPLFSSGHLRRLYLDFISQHPKTEKEKLETSVGFSMLFHFKTLQKDLPS